MASLKHKLFFSLIGASGSLSGIAASASCQGSHCGSCMGCAGIGIAMLLLLLYGKLTGSKPDE